MAKVAATEAMRAGLGAFLAVAAAATVVGLVMRPDLGLIMIAPFGASAVLLFAVPNSPLAQPWSAIMGNTVSAAAGVLAVRLIPDPTLGMAVAVGLAIILMLCARALHPQAARSR